MREYWRQDGMYIRPDSKKDHDILVEVWYFLDSRNGLSVGSLENFGVSISSESDNKETVSAVVEETSKMIT